MAILPKSCHSNTSYTTYLSRREQSYLTRIESFYYLRLIVRIRSLYDYFIRFYPKDNKE